MIPDQRDALRQKKNNLFKCLLLANFLQYLEAGAVPALLLQLSESFEMGPAKQGLLGGVVYLSLSLGGPFAGYLLRRYEHKTVICCAVAANMSFTLIWAFTPVGETYSTNMFIAVRFLMGLCQCVICVFLPLWTNENAPKETRTSWMSYLQASVPFGVMTGYIIASILTSISQHQKVCWGLLCWRWSFLIEVMLLTPLYFGLYFIPNADLAVCANRSNEIETSNAKASPQDNSSNTTAPLSTSVADSNEYMAQMERLHSAAFASKLAAAADTGAGSAGSGEEMPVSASGNPFLYLSPSQDKSGDALAEKPRSGSNAKSKRAVLSPEERKQCSSLRQTAMSASLYDSMSTRHAFKKSTENISSLGSKDDPYPILPGIRWRDAENGDGNTSSSARKHRTATTRSAPRYSLMGAGQDHGISEEHEQSGRGAAGAEGTDTHGPFFIGDSLLGGADAAEEDEETGRTSAAALNSFVSKSAGAKSNRSSLGASDVPQRTASTTVKLRGTTARTSRPARRLSLHEWLLGPLQPDAAAASDTITEGAEESTYLLGGWKHNSKNNTRGGDNARRSLDNSFRHLEHQHKEKPKNRRNSTSMVANPMSHSTKDVKIPKKAKPPPEPYQYESFKDITKKSELGSVGRPSWGVFSMLGYNRSRSNSGTGTELPFIGRATQSDKVIGSSVSPKPRNPNPKSQQRAVTPGGTHARRYSAGDMDLDFTLFDEVESPDPALPRTRSRTCSNPSRVASSALLSASKEGPAGTADGLPELQFYDDNDHEDGYDYGNKDDDGVIGADEENQLEEDAEVESCDEVSLSYDDMSYTESGSDSEEEEWAGLSPEPSYNSDDLSNYGTPVAATRRRSGAEYTGGSGRKATPARTPGGAEAGAAPPDDNIFGKMYRTCTRYYRYGLSVLAAVNALLAIKPYRYLLGAMSALYFTVTGVQFWGTKYLTVALHSPLPLVNTLFILCAATGPTLGVFFGGYIVDLSGGYKGAHQRVVALELCATFGVLGGLFSLPITFLSNIFAVVGLLWVVLFFGAAMLPACSGIVVSIIPRAYRPLSSALALMVFNMFGYFMSLLLSGFLMQVLDAHRDVCDEVCSMTWGFRLVLFWSFISLAFLLSALSASYQHLKDRDRGRSLRRRRSV